MEKSELAVGDSTGLEIVFNTGHYQGHISKRPKIETNEGPPDKSVQIIVDVVQRPDSTYPVQIKPYKINLTQFGEKVRNEVSFKLTNVSDTELVPKVVAAALRFFKVELPPSIKAGETVEGKVMLTDFGIKQSFEKSITFELNDAQATRFTVPVKRDLRPSVQQTDISQPETETTGN